MKLGRALFPCVVCVVLAGCASKQPAVSPTSSTELTSADATDTRDAAEKWAEAKAAAEMGKTKRETREGFDPLAVGSEIEESSIPNVDMTPANQVRSKSPSELNLAVRLIESASSVEEAAKKITQRLGKPNWTEAPKSSPNAKRRIWVAGGGAQCHRLVLESDGSVDVETVSKSDGHMMTASARQNPCTGEIQRGISK